MSGRLFPCRGMQHDFRDFGRFAQPQREAAPQSCTVADVQLHVADRVQAGDIAFVGHLRDPVQSQYLAAMGMAGQLQIHALLRMGGGTGWLVGKQDDGNIRQDFTKGLVGIGCRQTEPYRDGVGQSGQNQALSLVGQPDMGVFKEIQAQSGKCLSPLVMTGIIFVIATDGENTESCPEVGKW